MQFKTIVVIVSIIIVITIIGAIELNPTQNNIDEYAVTLDTVNVLLQNKEHVLVVDIRTAEDYQSRHLVGASHDVLGSTTIEKRVNTIKSKLPDIAKTYNFVIIDDGAQAKQVALTMTEMGLQTFYLDGGMSNLSKNLVSSSLPIINSEELMKKLDSDEDLYILDVREPDELLESKIDGSMNIPLAEIFQLHGTDDIPTDKPVVVVCGSGNRASIVSYALSQAEVDFRVLEGGMKA